jgi:hypothetical protein
MEGQTNNPPLDLQSYKEQVYGASPIVDVAEKEPAITPTSDIPENSVVIPEKQDQPEVKDIPKTDAPAAPIADFNLNEYIKSNFGYESEDDFKKEISELKKIKDTPIVEKEFANEESKKIYDNIKAGNTKEVRAYLEAKELLSNADSLQDEQKLKLFIKLQNPKFDQDLIEDEFAERYTFNEDEFTGDEIKLRKEKVKLAQRLEDDLVKAQDYFKQYQTKIELPNIEAALPAIDDDFKNYQENLSIAQEERKVLLDKLSKVSEKDVSIKLNYADEASKINIDIDYQFDKEGFDKSKNTVADYFTFLSKNYYTEDGSPMVDKFASDVYKIQNFDKILTEAVKQAVNATRQNIVATQKNIDPSGQRSYVQTPVDAIQKMREQVFS